MSVQAVLLYLRWPHPSCLMFAAGSDRGGWVHHRPCGAVIGKGDGTSFPGVTRGPGQLALRARRERGRREGGSVGGQHPGVAELTRVWVGAGRGHSQQWNLQLRAATATNEGHVLVSPSAGWLSFVLQPTHGSAIHRDDARLGLAVVDVQEADGVGGLAAAVGRRSGIKDPDAVADLVERYMGVPDNHELRGGEAAT